VENFRTGAMKSFGVDYETMAARNPKLIYCSLSGRLAHMRLAKTTPPNVGFYLARSRSCAGFGQTGPYASRGGFDLIAQAMSGLMSVTGEGGGRPPVKVGSPCTDIMCGTLGALGISGALRAREITGEGQLLDTSLYEAGIMLTYWQTAIYLGSGEVPEAMGSAHPLMAPCANICQGYPRHDTEPYERERTLHCC
jgi:crotonobetainyl-CoA:carnitine CoA-transferase CaiB-like acyl-CoA transferase